MFKTTINVTAHLTAAAVLGRGEPVSDVPRTGPSGRLPASQTG